VARGEVPARPAPGTLLTVGHSNRSLAEFLAILAAHHVEEIADVRRFPRSRRHPHFAIDALAPALAGAGIAYRHWPELGGFRKAAKDSPNVGLENASFRGYADHMATAAFQDALDRLLAAARERVVAVMCAEAFVMQCHRRLIADAALARGVPVEHVAGAGPRAAHRPTPGARLEEGRLVYRGIEPRLPGL
jgi:uncharacterized protein (DUF488 family)